jgi:hypothetical protein
MWHVIVMGEKRNACRIFVRKVKEIDYRVEKIGVNGRIILKWIFKKENGAVKWIKLDLNGAKYGLLWGR